MARTLIEETADLIGKVQSEAIQRRRAAAEELKALLLRNEKPNSGDGAKVAALIRELGIEPAQLPAMLEVVQKLTWYEGLVARESEIRQAVGKANSDVYTVDDWRTAEYARINKEAEAKKDALQPALSRAKAEEQHLAEARQWLTNIRAEWMAITDGISREDAMSQLHPRRGVPYGSAVRG